MCRFALGIVVAAVTTAAAVQVAAQGAADAPCAPYAYPEMCIAGLAPVVATGTGSVAPGSASAMPPCALNCTLTWVDKALPVPGIEGAAGGYIDDTIYVSHGHTSGLDLWEMRIYHVATDSWTFGADADPAFGRSEGVGTAVGGKMYSIGGRAFANNEEYDPATDTWTQRAPMSIARKGMAVGVINGKIHVVGGLSGSNMGPHVGVLTTEHEVYDPVTDTWALAAPLPQFLGDVYAAAAMGGKLYVFGGWSGVFVTDWTHIYDPLTDTWSTGAAMPTSRSNAVAAVLCNVIFVIGGLDSASVATTVVEAYDPATDTWCTGPSGPAIAETTTAGIATPNSIHIIGSGPGGASLSLHEALEAVPKGCLVPTLAPITNLKGVKDTALTGADFSWDSDPNAVEYHLNSVLDKRQVNATEAHLPPPPGVAAGQCTSPPSATPGCNDGDAIADGSLLYYQAFSACGAMGSDEGPFE